MKRVFFVQRLFAYMIDIMIITLVSSLLTALIPVSESYKSASERLENEYTELLQKTEKEEMMNMIGEIQDDAYIVGKTQSLLQLIEVVIYIIYFGVIQFYLGGYSLGKKVSKIKIVGIDGKEVSQNRLIARTILNYTLYIFIIQVFIYYLVPSSIFLYVLVPFSMLGSLYSVINLFMILFKKDGRGLTDIICKTMVTSL